MISANRSTRKPLLALWLSACAGLALLLGVAAPAAEAEVGVVPGSVVAKAHEPIPMACVSGSFPAFNCRIDVAAIRAAEPIGQAGSHPDGTGGGEIGGDAVKDFFIEAPPGFLANPTVVPACSREAFEEFWSLQGDHSKGCASASQVGVATIEVVDRRSSPVYRIAPSPGSPASFGFGYLGVGVIINANVRTDEDYGLTAGAVQISSNFTLKSTFVTLWGDPADPIHDPERWNPTKPREGSSELGDWGATSGLPRVPFLQTPTDCSNDRLLTTARLASWSEPGNFVPNATTPNPEDYAIPAPQPTGCEKLSFKPHIALIPSSTAADSPTGVSVQMEVPQNQDPDGLATPQLKKAVVTLPEGMSFNPPAADGLRGCSEAQIGLLTTTGAYPNPIRFAKGDASCPQASKVGRLRVKTALLDEELGGDVYVATPYENPFGTLAALYLVIRGPGFVVKVPGKVEFGADGRIVSVFDHNPQLPFDELDLDFFGGPRAPLATSPLCGTQEIATELTPWSAPQSGPPAVPARSYVADRGPAGAPCSFSAAQRPFGPQLSAGTDNPIAGGHSALTMRLTRPDGHQPLAGLTVKPPLGFSAMLKGMATCGEAQIAMAASRGPGGGGKLEASSPSCPQESRVGHTLTGAGAGPTPLFTRGEAYLAGPYKGAPLSLAVITPAIAGGTPGNEVFDLGVVVVRVALHVDPITAQVTAISDPIPQTLEGIPLRIRDVRVVMDRPQWGVNPTSCAEKLFEVQVSGQSGASASLSNRFQVVECANLGFKPRMNLRLIGGTKRGGHPSLHAVVRPRPGDANIKRAAVTLPRSAFLDQANIRTICTRVQWANDSCPKAARYGFARAFTPLLDQPLQGPVYLRSSNNLLPDLVADLRGPAHQPIKVEAAFRTDSIRGGIRSTIEMAPDAPVSRFVLRMQGGKRKGLIVNSQNLCAGTKRATARLAGHNGRRAESRPVVHAVNCKKQRKGAKQRGGKRSNLSQLKAVR